MAYEFDKQIPRDGTGSLKWDKYKSKDIIPLWVADMDFESAPEIMDALQARMKHRVFGYTIPTTDVVDSVVNYLDKQHGYKIEPNWIVWSPGIVPAINLFCRAFGEDGDSVMTATPVYPPFLGAPGNSRRELISVDLLWENDRWTFDFDAMEKAVKPNTRTFILCSPHNPVGRVFTKEELQQLAEFCERHDLVLCTDEIHCDLVLDENIKHVPTNLLGNNISQRTVMLMAPSKTYNLPGLCCAYAIIENPKIRQAFKKASQGIITEINAFGYEGIKAAYNHGEPWRKELINYLRGNRDYLYDFVSKHLPQIAMKPMEATYLAWMDVSALKLEDPTKHFEQHGVGFTNGTFFGSKDHVRLNFATNRATLEEGLQRMVKAVSKID